MSVNNSHYLLKNSDVAKKFRVSNPTVASWLDKAKQGLNGLEIVKVNKRYYIVDNTHNNRILSHLSKKGNKFKNKIYFKKCLVSDDFYKIFNRSQTIEIINSIRNAKQIPLKYTYFGEASNWWNQYLEENFKSKDSVISETVEFIKNTSEFFRLKFKKVKKINLIDIMPGSSNWAITLIEKLLEYGFEITYSLVEVDEILYKKIHENIHKKFPKITCRFIKKDLDYDVIRNELYDLVMYQSQASCNLIIAINSVLGNVSNRKRFLKNLRDSMSVDDYLWINNGMIYDGFDSEIVEYTSNPFSILKNTWIPNKLLGLDKSDYDIKISLQGESESSQMYLQLKKNVEIIFKSNNLNDTLELKKDDKIIIWNYFAYNTKNLFNDVFEIDFKISHLATYPDGSEFLILLEI